MKLVRRLFVVLVLLAGVVPLGAQNNFCAPPSPPPKPAPQDPPCPACEPKKCDKCTKSPVYVGAGTFVYDEMDLALRTTVFGIQVSRHYDSSRVFDGPLGIGWTSSLTPRLHYAVYAAGPSSLLYKTYIVTPHGGLHEFTRTGTGTYTPPLGRRDSLVANADGSHTLTVQDSRTVVRFNADGTVASVTDEFGSAIVYTYDANGRVQRVSDAAGSARFVDLTWNSSGRIGSVTDNAGRTVRYTYDTAGRLTGVADAVTPQGSQTRHYAYVDGRFAPLLSEVRDQWQRVVTTVDYDDVDRVESYTDGEFNVQNPAASTGERYRYEYFPKGDAFSPIPFTRKSSSLGQKSYQYVPGTGLVTNDGKEYSDGGQVIADSSDNGERTTYTYNAQGRLQLERMYTAYGEVEDFWAYTYDPAFPEKVATRKASRYYLWPGTRFVYYPAGSVAPGALKEVYQQRTDGSTEDKVAQYVTDSRGRVTAYAGPIGSPTFNYDYNATGDLTTVKRATLTIERYEYDSLGRVLKRFDAAGHATTYTYDAADRVLTVTLPKPTPASALDFTTTYVYDQYDASTGLTYVHATDPNGRVTKSGYDALGRLVKTIDALQGETKYEYQYDVLKSITDANGNRTVYAYDGERRLISTTYPDGNVEQYTYASSGFLATRTDRRGVLERHTYDRYGRLRSVTYPNNPRPSGYLRGVSFSYEGSLLRFISDTRQLDASGSTTTYDSMFRPITQQFTTGESLAYTYEHDANPAIATYTVHPAVGSGLRSTTVYYGYDTSGRVSTISFNESVPDVTIRWDARDLYDKIEFGNDLVRDYAYDDQGRLTSVANTHPAGEVATFTYGYDLDWQTSTYTMLGQRHRVDVSAHTYANQLPGLTKYRYDANYQLSRVDEPGGAWQLWQYDAIGNRVASQTNTSGVVTYPYYKYAGNPNNSSRLATWTYDANGNRTSSGEEWDVANRLVNYGGTSYIYDYAERRIQNGARNYIYHGLNMAREREGSTVLNDYLFGPGIDEPLVRLNKANAKHYFAADGLGSVVAAVDASGAVTEGKRYDVWGTDKTGPGSPATFGFTGREHGGPGVYLRARYYNAAAGRFLSEDPLTSRDRQLRMSMPSPVTRPDVDALGQTVNEYWYAVNNPVRFSDPTGLDAEGCDGVPACFETKKKLNCCYEHDQCYAKNKCTAWSWETKWPPKCNACNALVVCCFSGICKAKPAPPDWLKKAYENDPPPKTPKAPPPFKMPKYYNGMGGSAGWFN